MKRVLLALMLLACMTPAFAGKNVIHDAWKLQKKLRKDPNVEKVVESYIDRGDSGYDEFEVYVTNCYNHESLHRIPAWYKGTQIRIHCVGLEKRSQPTSGVPNTPR